MSEVRVNNIVDYGGKGAPTFDNGAVISGVSSLGNQAKIGSNVTITSGGINVSGVTTAATLSGNLTGDVNTGFVTATSAVIGSGVTINAGGLNITGVMTATTFEGSGASMTGVAMTITPLSYNPDPSDSIVTKATGIGITFDHRLLAGSGNITLSIATNAGAAGTVVENFGVGSSVTIAGRKASIDPASNLTAGETYHISYPSGAFTNTSGDISYVGTAYTFGVKPDFYQLWGWGRNNEGQLAQNNKTDYSSPVQIPGTTWESIVNSAEAKAGLKSDNTLWVWGNNWEGTLGQNSRTHYSSPVQIPGTTWKSVAGDGNVAMFATKTDGTLWSWGNKTEGRLGLNSVVQYSSPMQIPGTTWDTAWSVGSMHGAATRTDGTLWVWGHNGEGALGLNDVTQRSSPTQLPGTWSIMWGNGYTMGGIKTDGTLWIWGDNGKGTIGNNESGPSADQSSPVQVGSGTDWADIGSAHYNVGAVKTDGTLWTWGNNEDGSLGHNNAFPTSYSSPTQLPGTTWAHARGFRNRTLIASKTDNTLWSWGDNEYGMLGQNAAESAKLSSPTQIPGTGWDLSIMSRGATMNDSVLAPKLL